MRQTILVLTLVALVACGGGPEASPVSADALPGRPGELVPLDAIAISVDAVDPSELETLLADAGFAGGTQRTFAQAQGPRQRRFLARVLAFTDAGGAGAYLDWLREHVEEVIGTAELLEPPDLPGVSFLALANPDCCPKATEIYLVAWRRGSTVLTLEVGGDGLDEALVASLAQDLDGSVAT